MPSIRKFLEGLDPAACAHPYLAFERLIADNHVEGDGKWQHQVKALQRGVPPALKEAYGRTFKLRNASLIGFNGGTEGAVTRFFSLPVQGRLAAGLGNASVLENGLSLNHTYGLPYLPGTGLKGMASAMAHLGLADAAWQRGVEKDGKWTGQGEDHKVLFGTMDTGAEDAAAGIVIFHDAWWDPEPEQGKPETQLPYEPDVMTPHHQEYNRDVGEWPNDWESPIPLPFVTVRGTFRLALTGPEAWVEAAYEILKMAFEHLGFGAKTQIGHGRGELGRFESPEEKTAREADEKVERDAQAERDRLEDDRKAADLQAERVASQKTVEGKLFVVDAGRGSYRLSFGEFELAEQHRGNLKSLSGEGWDILSDDAKKRKDKGGRVRVSFCIENGKPVLLALSPNVPQG